MKGNITRANHGSRRSVHRTAWVSDEDAGEVHGVGSRDPKVREGVGGRCAVDLGVERGGESTEPRAVRVGKGRTRWI